MPLGYRNQSSVIAGFGFIIAIVAIIGTQFMGWEWGDGQLVTLIIGVIIAGIALLVVGRRMVNFS